MTQNDPNAVIDEAANKLTIPFEGEVLHPYQDSAGVWTIGTGSTFDLAGNRVTAATPPITHMQNLVLLHREMLAAFRTVEADTPVALTVEEEAALVDFVFNLGAGNYWHSALLGFLKAGNFLAAANEFLVWDHSRGMVLAGLARRCAARRAEFLSGMTGSGSTQAA